MANKQTLVHTGRNKSARGGGNSRARGGAATRRGRSQSTMTPGPREQRIVKLKINYDRLPEPYRSALLQPTAYSAPYITPYSAQPVKADEDELPEEDEALPTQQFVTGHLADPFVEPQGHTTRAGRQIKVPMHADTVYLDSDMLEPSSVGKVDEEDEEEEYHEPASSPLRKLQPAQQSQRNKYSQSPPAIHIMNHPNHRKPGRPRKIPPLPAPTHIHRAIDPRSPPYAPPPALILNIDPRTYEILTYLTQQPVPATSLPELETPGNPNVEEPYSAKFLVELYMIAYAAGHWDTCDLVVDTWIRMFHRLRQRTERVREGGDGSYWRINKVLLKLRKFDKKLGFDDNPPTYGEKLTVEDPALNEDAGGFDRELLNRLYTHTNAGCGARFAWADCMALSGSRFGKQVEDARKKGEVWHGELLQDVVYSLSRIANKKLTLKIEEGTEGVWCRRYHEHGKRRLKCYREVAARAEGWVEEEVLGKGKGKKKARGNGDMNGGRAKRARVEWEVVDVDAEGESE